MKGLDVSRAFYEQYGKDMLEKEFPDYINKIAVGLVGEGSECLGYDDDLSVDHDFEAGFCLFISREDYDKIGFKLERAYAKLPKEFMGYKRSVLSPVGGDRHGVIVIEDFYQKFLGASDIPDDLRWWLYADSTALLNASNGQVFYDPNGEFSRVREKLLVGFPDDVRRKKLAMHAIFMAQAGQYNYKRIVSRGEYGAGQLALFEFVKHAISTVYLLNNKYEPFYKWAFRGMRSLPVLSELEDALVGLIEIENSPKTIDDKIEIIEDVARLIIDEYKRQGLTKATCNNLESHAYSILDGVKNSEIRNIHIMEGV